MKSVLTLAALAAVALASAQLSVSGSLTTSDPRFNRPQSLTSLSVGDGTAAAYDVYTFVPTATGVYVAEMDSNGANGLSNSLDTYLLVYSGTFNPATPLANLLNGDDDYTGAFSVLSGSSGSIYRGSRIASGDASNYAPTGLVLTAGSTYSIVATSFSNATAGDGTGTYRIGVAQAVPEPATISALGLGIVAMLRRRKRA